MTMKPSLLMRILNVPMLHEKDDDRDDGDDNADGSDGDAKGDGVFC